MGEKAFITGTRAAAPLTGRPEGSAAKWARRRPCEVPSCGREVMVFPVEGPEDLPGIHPDLIGAALRPGERLRSLVYAPIWDGHEAPFGVRAEPASHAVAVTNDRFLVSSDPHRKRRTPSLRVIPFRDVLSVESGSSLLPGWLVVRFSDGEKAATASFLYESTYGIEHFGALVREYRAAVRPARRPLVPSPPLAWSELWRHVAPRQAGRLEPVLVEGESLAAFACSSQTWGTRASLWGEAPICVAEAGVVVVTDCGVVHVVNEPDLRPDIWSFGINMRCIPHEALRSCVIVERVSAGVSLQCLRLKLARGRVAWHMDVPVGDSYVAVAARLSRMLEGSG